MPVSIRRKSAPPLAAEGCQSATASLIDLFWASARKTTQSASLTGLESYSASHSRASNTGRDDYENAKR
jgi:hypothetical protein